MVSGESKLALAEQKLALRTLAAKKKIALKRAGTVSKRFAGLKQLRPAPMLSQEQMALQDMFGGEPTFGTGQNLPVIRGELRRGGGIIKSGDNEYETASIFGF